MRITRKTARTVMLGLVVAAGLTCRWRVATSTTKAMTGVFVCAKPYGGFHELQVGFGVLSTRWSHSVIFAINIATQWERQQWRMTDFSSRIAAR